MLLMKLWVGGPRFSCGGGVWLGDGCWAAGEVVGRQEGVGKESVRRWVVQAQVDGGQRPGTTSEELGEIKALKAKVRRLEEDNEILQKPRSSSRGSSTPDLGGAAFRPLRPDGLNSPTHIGSTRSGASGHRTSG